MLKSRIEKDLIGSVIGCKDEVFLSKQGEEVLCIVEGESFSCWKELIVKPFSSGIKENCCLIKSGAKIFDDRLIGEITGC